MAKLFHIELINHISGEHISEFSTEYFPLVGNPNISLAHNGKFYRLLHLIYMPTSQKYDAQLSVLEYPTLPDAPLRWGLK